MNTIILSGLQSEFSNPLKESARTFAHLAEYFICVKEAHSKGSVQLYKENERAFKSRASCGVNATEKVMRLTS